MNRVTVSVLHNYSEGGQPFSITIPFDKLTGIMRAAAVEQKRSAGLVIESDQHIGFYLASSLTPTEEPVESRTGTTQIKEPAAESETATPDQEAEPVLAPPCTA